MGVTAVVDTGVWVDVGLGVDVAGFAGFAVAVGCGGTAVGEGEEVGKGVAEPVGVGHGVSVTVAKRVLVLVTVAKGVRVGRLGWCEGGGSAGNGRSGSVHRHNHGGRYRCFCRYGCHKCNKNRCFSIARYFT